jgi:hypothetical protein
LVSTWVVDGAGGLLGCWLWTMGVGVPVVVSVVSVVSQFDLGESFREKREKRALNILILGGWSNRELGRWLTVMEVKLWLEF